MLQTGHALLLKVCANGLWLLHWHQNSFCSVSQANQCNVSQLEQLLDDLGPVEDEEEEEEEDGDMVNNRFWSLLLDQLLKNMPVFGVHKNSTKHWVLVNIHNFSFLAEGHKFLDLLLLNQEEKQDTQAHGIYTVYSNEGQSLQQITPVYNHLPQCKPGCKPLHAPHAKIVNLFTDFSPMHGFATESCCRQTVGNAVAVMLIEVKAHVLSRAVKERYVALKN